MPFDWLPWLLQLNDSQFPSGGYAHSLGLEELVQANHVGNFEQLRSFLQDQILPSLLAFELPYLANAHRAAATGDVAELALMDHELDAWKLAPELRAASQRMGARRFDLVQKLAPSEFHAKFATFDTPKHHLIICALEYREIPLQAAACSFLWQTISGYVTAAVKLLRLGQEKAQGLIFETLQLAVPKLETALESDFATIGWFNPLLEIASLRHADARERLFIS